MFRHRDIVNNVNLFPCILCQYNLAIFLSMTLNTVNDINMKLYTFSHKRMTKRHNQNNTNTTTKPASIFHIQVHLFSFITPYLLEMKSPKTNFAVLELKRVKGRSASRIPPWIWSIGRNGPSNSTTDVAFGRQWRESPLSACFVSWDDNNVEIYGWLLLFGDLLL